MFTIGRNKFSVYCKQDIYSGFAQISKEIPHKEIINGTIESIVFRVLKFTYGVGNQEYLRITNHVANLVTTKLTAADISLFSSIQGEGGIYIDGLQDEEIRKIFARMKRDIPLLAMIMKK